MSYLTDFPLLWSFQEWSRVCGERVPMAIGVGLHTSIFMSCGRSRHIKCNHGVLEWNVGCWERCLQELDGVGLLFLNLRLYSSQWTLEGFPVGITCNQLRDFEEKSHISNHSWLGYTLQERFCEFELRVLLYFYFILKGAPVSYAVPEGGHDEPARDPPGFRTASG